MNPTQIEWVRNPDGSQGYTWNPITGCLNHVNGLCKGGGFPCYAYKLAHGRLSSRYLAGGIVADEGQDHENLSDPFYPRFWEERLKEAQRGYHYKASYELVSPLGAAPRGVFVCDMSDLFGIGIPEEWTRRVLSVMNENANQFDRFYLLTKQPQNLIKFSPFPENCWVGVTATNRAAFGAAKRVFDNPISSCGIRAKVKYISFEPLLEPIICKHEWVDKIEHKFRSRTMPVEICSKCGQGREWGDHNREFIGADGKPIIQWLIIGACTGTFNELMSLCPEHPELMMLPFGSKWTLQPRIEWVKEIVEAADKAGIKIFLKNNLSPLLPYPQELWAFTKVGGLLRQEMPE